MVAIYKVINTVIYNQKDTQNIENSNTKSISFQNIPAKYKNFQEELQCIVISFREILTQENIIHLLNLLSGKYLKLDSLSLWEDDPDNFIEVEDEQQYGKGSSIDKDCSYNTLAYLLCNKILEYFKESSHSWLADQITHILNHKIPSQILLDFANEKLGEVGNEDYKVQVSILVEDAILSLVGLLPTIYSYFKIPEENRVKIEIILNYLESRIGDTHSKILKRRY